jgi:hypothetical protein
MQFFSPKIHLRSIWASSKSAITEVERFRNRMSLWVGHGRYATFQLAEVAIPKALFAEIPRRTDGLRPAPLPP